MADITIRTIRDCEREDWVRAYAACYLDLPIPNEASIRFREVAQQHTWAVYMHEQIIGTLRLQPTEITVPGGRQAACGAASYGSMSPGFQGRGHYRRLMIHVLRHARDSGLALAVAIMEDDSPYSGFGWGPIARNAIFQIDPRRAVLARTAGVPIRAIGTDEFLRRAAGVFEGAARHRPGTLPRSLTEWEALADPVSRRGPGKVQRHAIFAEEHREPVGYAIYDAARKWDERGEADFSITAEEVVARDADAETALLGHLLGLALVKQVAVHGRVIGDHLPLLFKDGRGIQELARCDGLWARILNVPQMLCGRSYLASDAVTLEVTDRDGIAGGRYRLTTSPDGAECEATHAPADAQVSVGDLAVLVMAGNAGCAMRRAGRLTALTDRGAACWERIFDWPEAPWSPAKF